MEIKKMKIEELIPADYNPRVELTERNSEFKALKRSLETFGYVTPIILNKRNNTIVGGHQRLNVLKHLGFTEIDVAIVDLDATEEKALNISLNKISGEWDYGELANMLSELKETQYFASTGFDESELKDLMGDLEDVKAIIEDEEGEYEEPEPDSHVEVRIGEYKFEIERAIFDKLMTKIHIERGYEKLNVATGLGKVVFGDEYTVI